MTNKERYETFMQTPKKIWNERLTWKGRFGDSAYYKVSIVEFFLKVPFALEELLKDVTTVTKFRRNGEKLFKRYLIFVSNEVNLEKEDVEDLGNFFIGALGEIFFNCFLTNIGSIVHNNHRYHITSVAPSLEKKDFGVDGTCVYDCDGKTVDCAVQIKFWNPYADTPMTLHIAQGVYGQAVGEKLIDPNVKENVIICWLGYDEKVSRFLKRDNYILDHILFIDLDTLNKEINCKFPTFWNSILPEYIKNLL